jgi:hypothetical protein
MRPIYRKLGIPNAPVERDDHCLIYRFIGGLELKCLGELNPMSKQDDYLDNAAQTLNLANHVSRLAQRFLLLDLAEKWVELADRSHRQAEHSAGPLEEHPLVKRAFREV